MENTYREESNYQEEESSMKEIVLRHIKKISDISCQELTGGYWQEKPFKTSGGVIFTKEYHEDVREAYCNAIDFLIDVLYPTSDSLFRRYIDDNEKLEETFEIKAKLLIKRKIFKEINKMFERTNFFSSNESMEE